MNVAVVGAGAIGGYLAARLAAAGDEVTVVARGANLAAIRAHGLRLIGEDGAEVSAPVRAVERAAEAGAQDFVLLTVKAHQVAPIAADIGRLDAPVVTMQNGIPWWYFHKHGGVFDGRPVRAADPDGTIARSIDPDRVIGSVVYPAADLIAPGVVRVVEGNRFSLAEIDGQETPRVVALSGALERAGFRAPVVKDLRGEIWLKLWGNLSFNPVSALTHATLADICTFPPTRDLSARMMAEAAEIARKLGVRMRISIERRIAGAERVGAHKTSMLQDVEHGRPIELDALVGAVVELGEMTLTPTPTIGAVYACAALLARRLAATGGRLSLDDHA
jgi:2-dehydropantoate 2-reductase